VSRVVVVIDGEHYPPVVCGALAELAVEHEILAAVFAGGTEKVGAGGGGYGVPLFRGADPAVSLTEAIAVHAPDAVIDLSDEPVLSAGDRFRLASLALGMGVDYLGADFAFRAAGGLLDMATPALAVVGTGKRVGKTAVAAHIARTLAADGLDLAVLGLGMNGHVGFNEPGSRPDDGTRLVRLAVSSRMAAVSRYGAGWIPTAGITVGLARLLEAGECWLMVTGERKAAILRRTLDAPEGPDCPASYLRRHSLLTVFADEAAASMLRRA